MNSILLHLAFFFRWKSQKWADLFIKEHKKRIQKLVDDIDLDVNDMKFTDELGKQTHINTSFN